MITWIEMERLTPSCVINSLAMVSYLTIIPILWDFEYWRWGETGLAATMTSEQSSGKEVWVLQAYLYRSYHCEYNRYLGPTDSTILHAERREVVGVIKALVKVHSRCK